MNPPYRRAMLGIVLAIGMLGALPVAVFAAQPTCGQTLTTNTTLTANLDCSAYNGTALFMGANGITLNLNGKTIIGYGGDEYQYGVYTNGYDRTTITNGTIRNFYIAVYVSESNKTTVSFLNVDGENPNVDYGIYEYYGVYNVFNHITAVDTYEAVYMEGSAGSTLKNSNLTSTDIAVYPNETTAAVITNNILHGDSYGGYEYESNRNTWSGNSANGGDYGFYFDCRGWGVVTVTGNTANNNSSTGFYVYECYEVDHPVDGYTGTRVTGNTANGNDYGFEDYDSYNELWKSNFAADNDYDGFYLDSPSRYRIVYNTSLRNDHGFYITDNKSWYNAQAVSYNTARRNDSNGFYAQYGTPGTGNVSVNNSPNKCVNVHCT